MELKRSREADFEKCVICQDDKRHEKLLNASEQGLATLKDSASTRHKLRERDVEYRLAIERITTLQGDIHVAPVWHKSCYSSFTSKSKISRLEKNKRLVHMSASTSDNEGSRRTLRSSTEPIDWTLCMFCQKSDITKLSAVTTLKMSKRIIDASKYDQILSVRLSSVNDLIATEGKYHCSCYKAFMRRASKASVSISTVDLAMQWLVEELKTSAKQGHILELSEVWNRYCEIAEVAGTEVPQSFVSRRKTLKRSCNRCLVSTMIL